MWELLFCHIWWGVADCPLSVGGLLLVVAQRDFWAKTVRNKKKIARGNGAGDVLFHMRGISFGAV
ncbi:hypothetical protein [uncultured Aliiroseovarius sp.]|uniref:hypothetical protein n=1 Tax=uncultured Aliiroseovarius sp. TaxID=1658783 RepID=UPI0026087585|nr:hypothetical protein [uncultured Aliiroseovarius sp.]